MKNEDIIVDGAKDWENAIEPLFQGEPIEFTGVFPEETEDISSDIDEWLLLSMANKLNLIGGN